MTLSHGKNSYEFTHLQECLLNLSFTVDNTLSHKHCVCINEVAIFVCVYISFKLRYTNLLKVVLKHFIVTFLWKLSRS